MPAALKPDEYVDYPLRYEDHFGVVDTVCHSNGRELELISRGGDLVRLP